MEKIASLTECDVTFFGHKNRRDAQEILGKSSIFALLSSDEGLSTTGRGGGGGDGTSTHTAIREGRAIKGTRGLG